jgi:hypothetical protein
MTMNFDQAVYGLGFEQLGINFIDISIDGGATFFDISTNSGDAPDFFFGIVNELAFSSVIFEINPPDVGDGGFLDNPVYTTEPPPNGSVPEPASGLLLLTGLFVLRRALRR